MFKFQIGSYKLNLSMLYFGEQEYGEAHCNLGNLKLCHDTMVNWIKLMEVKE